jgi:hypothetical protein
MNNKLLRPLVLLLSALFISGCNNGSSDAPAAAPPQEPDQPMEPEDPEEPEFSAALFNSMSANITNTYFPMIPGTTLIYEGENEDGEFERIEVNVSHLTRQVDGVESAIGVFREYVTDQEEDESELQEEAFDWFAQDSSGNVWYMGEEVFNYEDGEFIDMEGSWESGMDVAGTGNNAIAGIQMKSNPTVGDTYLQENYPGQAEDFAEVIALDASLTLADGNTYDDLLQIEEQNPLEPSSPFEYKYYLRGTGLLVEEAVDGSERFELVATKDQRTPDIGPEDFTYPRVINNPHSPMTIGDIREYEVYEEGELVETISIQILGPEDEGGDKMVNGIQVIVQRDRVMDEDGNIIEDTFDWFAQDDDGNVWYVGEEVTNYNYDDDGVLIDTDDGGSFEWGIDGAQPGIQMLASPRRGDSYRQEYYAGEAEDIGAVIALDSVITLDDDEFTTLETEDWNPLEPDEAREHKFYARGLGVIREEKVDGSEYVELVERTIVEADIDPSDFSNPRVIDNVYFPLIPGDSREYEVYEDDELIETITIEILTVNEPGGDKTVNGVPVVVQRDRVRDTEGRVIEDTYDWFAQDDDGNVWYVGEEVTNYEYDEDGNLLSTDSEGSFEWGMDGALPGIQMLADPMVDDYYRQEFYAGEAEDVAMVIGLNVTIEVDDEEYSTLQTLDWNPLDEDGEIEVKYYAPGIGVVKEEKLDGSEEVIFIAP